MKKFFESLSKKGYGTKSVTEQGEEVKSVAEKRITDYFVKNKITYLYEEEARRKVLWVLSVKISYPDFFLLLHSLWNKDKKGCEASLLLRRLSELEKIF